MQNLCDTLLLVGVERNFLLLICGNRGMQNLCDALLLVGVEVLVQDFSDFLLLKCGNRGMQNLCDTLLLVGVEVLVQDFFDFYYWMWIGMESVQNELTRVDSRTNPKFIRFWISWFKTTFNHKNRSEPKSDFKNRLKLSHQSSF
ncbi:3130_t:CDS:2 [Rhizophagus irregularis]|nr:3130_t:CDS:2 [Rhizophagus irregularis]